jgi:hypothetical protein
MAFPTASPTEAENEQVHKTVLTFSWWVSDATETDK